MKLFKIASVLFVGSVLFSPMAVQSKPLGAGYGETVRLNQSLWQKCTAVAEAKILVDNEAVMYCAVVGVYVEGENLNPGTKDAVLDLVDNAQTIQVSCIKLSKGMGTDDIDTIKTCAMVGVGVDNTNLD